jgi:hypothetical protein
MPYQITGRTHIAAVRRTTEGHGNGGAREREKEVGKATAGHEEGEMKEGRTAIHQQVNT